MASKVPQTVNQPPAVQPTPAPRPGGSASALPARLPPAVRLVAPEPAQGEDVAPGTLDLKTMGSSFAPPEAIASFLDARQTSRVNVRLGKLAAGTLSVETRRKGKYQVKQQPIPLAHPLFLGANPALFLRTEGQQLKGQIGFVSGTKLDALSPDDLKKAPELLGLTGFHLERFPTFVNTLEAGQLRFGIKGVALTLGSVFVGKLDLEAVDETVTFAASAEVDTKGLAKGSLQLNRAPDGQISGKVSVGLAFSKGGKNLSGSVEVTWDGNAVGGEGKLGYSGEKLSGSITVHLMEKTQAQRLEQEKKAPSAEGAAQKPAPPKTPGRKLDYVVFGEGDLTFAFNDWLHGTAHVILDPFGFVTIIGKITPQKEFPLFDPKDYNKHLFKLEARATYGLPVVGNIFIFANVGLEAFAKMQGKFYNIIAQGTYSTDPQKAKDFSIQGSLNISAVAGLTLRAEAGVGVEILSHDIKAGAGINGTAGIRGYAEATPIIGYREPASEGQDKKGEWFIRGEIEIAAQPFLGLSGDLFVELSTPWWSPLSDDRWTWPLFNKEWPIGGSYGVGATLDYVFGSGQWPKLDFKPVEFSSEKFTSDMFDKKGQPGMGWREQKGKWQEKNNAAAQPPPKVSPPGNAKPGKALTPTPAKPKVGRGTRKSTRAADPNAKTVSGKTVKQYQDEAAKKGKQPPGAPKDEAAKKEKQAHDEELKKGLAALDAVTKGYAKKGATKEELVTALKAVRRKFKVFKSIEVVPDGKKWKYHYVASEGDQPGPPMLELPPTHVTSTPEGEKGKYVLARPLTKIPGNTKGSKSTSARIPADARITALNRIADNWVKMHLLHFDLHGPNKSWNFTPGTHKSNSDMNEVEQFVIQEIKADKVYWYEVDVTYRKDEDDTDFPLELMVRYGLFDHQKNEPISTKNKPIKVPPPGEGIHVAFLNFDGRKRLRNLGGLTPTNAASFVVIRKQYGKLFNSLEDVGLAIINTRGKPGGADVETLAKNIDESVRNGKLRL